jgi:adenine-specific DNA-methyltransferase
LGGDLAERYDQVELADGTTRPIADNESSGQVPLPIGSRAFALQPAISAGYRSGTTVDYTLNGRVYHPGPTRNWKYTIDGMDRLAKSGRLVGLGKMIYYKRYIDDFPAYALGNIWVDTQDRLSKTYVVQTVPLVIQRCILMTTDPGDLVLDPTCGSGTSAYVAEQWGRRWISIDTSRVPLALARQRLLTATFKWYRLRDESAGPSGGFVFARKQNRKGEESGGIVPHVTMKSIANDEPPAEEVLVDRPEIDDPITRITGPFVAEATLPTPQPMGDEPTATTPRTNPVTTSRV